MEYSGAGGKPMHEKTRSKKSRDTVPLTEQGLRLHGKKSSCYTALDSTSTYGLCELLSPLLTPLPHYLDHHPPLQSPFYLSQQLCHYFPILNPVLQKLNPYILKWGEKARNYN